MESVLNLALLADMNGGTARGAIIFAAIGVGCLLLAAKAFSEKGLPFTNAIYITGKPAKIIGIVVGLLGVGLLVTAGLVLIASTQTA